MQKKPVYKPPFKPGANRPKPGPRPMRGRREDLHRINLKIVDTPTVRVIGDDFEGGIFPFSKAYEMAVDANLDLVEISPNADPPVCKIVDYKKYLYEQKKKQKELKANAVNNEVKEIRFGPNTDEHDVEFKLNHARKFLNEGSKVRAYVFFKGRTIVYKERGEVLLLKFAEKLQEEGIAKLELMPKTEGKKMFMLLAPTKKK